MKRGEEVNKMKTYLAMILAAAVVLALPQAARADISVSVAASVSGGTALGPHALLKCTGYSYDENGDPWSQCASLGTATTLEFGALTTRLYDSGGNDTGAAGCFYGKDFYIMYLFPDAWGGKGYELKQSAGTFSPEILNSVVRTPVYSAADKYSASGPGQGALTPTEVANNPQLNNSYLAKDAGLILKAKRPRIVRAEYGIPPFPATGDTRPTGWSAVPIDTTAGSYSGAFTITMTEWQ